MYLELYGYPPPDKYAGQVETPNSYLPCQAGAGEGSSRDQYLDDVYGSPHHLVLVKQHCNPVH
jgi:hypothetical protein